LIAHHVPLYQKRGALTTSRRHSVALESQGSTRAPSACRHSERARSFRWTRPVTDVSRFPPSQAARRSAEP
jgi:hypothetical protein